eukprot:CAMPEP_0183355190 /NCGR_PEP_ID=MMETSP0164_2-20130417/39470_1 /TAXON_ID=221442 /ORGANISM="Coccolithus pelagicus ssp braarudi, Strain PLY182g" /LENGTH=65 /DNA_ID=CAMNT_0025528221 /DNA_START=46 /DNA_END=243 /DNA_ORIENTATION=-
MRTTLLALLLALIAVMASSVPDPCLDNDYAHDHYGECCANGGYKIEGHGEICKTVGPKVKARREL